MNEILIQRTDGTEVRFDGELLVVTEKTIDFQDDFHRQLTLTVFAISEGGFVARLQYSTAHPDEAAVDWTEDLDNLEQVEKFYFVFEPSEVLPDFARIHRSERDARTKAYQRLIGSYESVVFPFLDRLRMEAGRRQCRDRHAGVQSTKRSFWNAFKFN